jgi:beta-N-acetylhexosaminidase
MSTYIRRHVGQLVVAGFDGPTIPDDLRRVARDFDLGGVILFARNVEEPVQVAELSHDAQGLASELPLWVSIDQEGGRVARLRQGFTEWPPMRALGNNGTVELTRRFAVALAREMRAVGISLDYVPVLDVGTNPGNPAIGDRALSADPELVATLGAEIVNAVQTAGVAACGKHFPGHGDTSTDSHHELPIVEHPLDRLRAVELTPFRAAIKAGVAMLMTAHVLYPAIDEESPGTLSRRIVQELLREDLGFTGVIATDDMSMKAIANERSVETATVQALTVGCDLALLCTPDADSQVATLEAIIRAVEDRTLSVARVEDALKRGRRAKERFLAAPAEWRPPSARELRRDLGSSEHEAIADEIRRFA